MKKTLLYLPFILICGCSKIEIDPKVEAEWKINYFDGTQEIYTKEIAKENDLILDVNYCLTFKYDVTPIRCNVRNYQRIK